MLYQREGYPEEGELVLCTVTKVFHHSVFAHLDEYDKGGLIHISEVSPGRIRNIRDYVTVGKKIVCKVLRIDQARGHIDLSLRRVNEGEKKRKVEEIKQEQKAEKVIEIVAKELGEKKEKIYDSVTSKVFEHYPYLHLFFKDLALGEARIEDLKLESKLAKILKEIVVERFKPAKVEIKGVLNLSSWASDGIEVIKKTLAQGEQKGVLIAYLGGGRYKIKVEAGDYKEAEGILKKVSNEVISYIEKHKGEGSFERE